MFGRKIPPTAWSYAAIAFAVFCWAPPVALLAGGLIVFIAWCNGERTQSKSWNPVRRWRSSRVLMVAKFFALIIGILLVPAAILSAGGETSTPLTNVGWILMCAGVITAVFVGGFWLVQNVLMDLIFRGRNASYDHFRETGGDPFFDNQMRWPFNTDSETVRLGGLPEPEYNNPNYQPQLDWDYQCPNCGARLPDDHNACWHCGYNWGGPPWEYECGTCGVRVPTEHGCWNCGTGPTEVSPDHDGTAPIDT